MEWIEAAYNVTIGKTKADGFRNPSWDELAPQEREAFKKFVAMAVNDSGGSRSGMGCGYDRDEEMDALRAEEEEITALLRKTA
jgi:hypothetical protein